MNFMGEPERHIPDTETSSPHLSSDELISNYIKLWNEAHSARIHGNEPIALEIFAAAYSLLDKIEKALEKEISEAESLFDGDFESDLHGASSFETKWLDLAYKRAGCLDSILVCKTALRKDPDEMIDTIHYGIEALIKMLDYVLPDCEEEDDSSIGTLIDNLQNNLPASVADVEAFEVNLAKVYEYITTIDDLTQLKWAQLFFYYITRWAYNVRDYFQDASAQKQLFQAFENLSRKAAVFGQHVRSMVEERIDDRDNYDNKISGQTKWLELYPTIQRVENKEGDFKGAIEAFEEIREMLAELEMSTDYGNREYAFVIKMSHAYAAACKDYDNYGLFSELEEAMNNDFPRVKMRLIVAKARVALRHNDISEAERAFAEAEDVKKKMSPGEKHVFEEQLKVIRAQIDIIRYQNDPVMLGKAAAQTRIGKVLSETMEETEIKKAVQLDILDGIERNFPKDSLQTIRIKRQDVTDLLLEAERCLVLGKIETERVAVNMDDYARENFERARTYLLTAYSILLEYGYGDPNKKDESVGEEGFGKDPKLYDEIEAAYKRLIDLNNQITGISEKRREEILADIDMRSTVHFFQLEEWGRDFDQLCDENIETKLLHVVRRFAPNISKIKIVKASQVCRLPLAMQTAYELHRSAANEFKGYNAYVNYPAYSKKNAGYIAVLPLDTCDEHCILIESDYELPDHAKRLLKKIASGTTKVLKNGTARTEKKSLEIKAAGAARDPEALAEIQRCIYAVKSRIKEYVTAIFKDLLRKDISTVHHSIFVAELSRDIGSTINKALGVEVLDIEELFSSALWHDIGKHIIAQHVLSKPSRIHDKEVTHVQEHPMESVVKLVESLGLEGNVDVIVPAGMHHVRDAGSRPGYPTIPVSDEKGDEDSLDVKGRQFFTEMPKWLAGHMEGLTDEQRKLLSHFSVKQKLMKDVLAFADIIQALTGKRAYRESEGLEGLVGYINSNVGVDFPYYMARIVTRMINEGKLLRILTYGEVGDGEATYNFPLPEGYELDRLYEYIDGLDPHEFEDKYGLNHKAVLKNIKKSTGKDFIVSKRTIRSDMFGTYMRVYGTKKEETEEQFGNLMDEFVGEFSKWAGEPLSESFEIGRYRQWEEEARLAA